MKNVLVADVPSMDARYAAAFAGWELAFARTMAEARQALGAARRDLVAVGVYFDDSRMFDLVRVIRGEEGDGEVPLVCVRGHQGSTSVAGRTLEAALKALGADAFIDLLHFGDEAAGNAALRACAEGLLTG